MASAVTGGATALWSSRRCMFNGTAHRHSSDRRVTMHLKRAPTTTGEFERPEHKHLRWNKQVQAKLQGVVKTVPITPTLVDPVLRRLCGVGDGQHATQASSSSSPLNTWTLRRQTKYGGNSKHWLNTRPPVLHLVNDKGVEAAVVHPPPILPLPQADEMSVAAYLASAVDGVLGPRDATMHDVCAYADQAAQHSDPSAHRDKAVAMHPGVGVVLLTREEFTFFVVKAHFDHYVFLHQPERYVSDDHNVTMDPTVDGADGQGLPNRRLAVLTDTLSTFATALLSSHGFHSASTWYYRVDADVGDLMKSVLTDTNAALPLSSVSLEDPRWTMLPRSKLLKNAKWNARPETMAEESKYGLVEVLGGASPQILSWAP